MFEILGTKISSDKTPFIIAEISANHNGSIELAKSTILAAKKAGASAIKIQSYTADTMTIDCDNKDFLIQKGLWKGRKLYDLYSEAHTPFEWHKELFDYAKQIGIILFSTPFDESAVELLEELNTPAYKIASFELTDLPLIEFIAKKNKPILMSTGMGTLQEIGDAVAIIRKYNNSGLLLFHCVSSYPTPTEQMNLSNINILREKFEVEVGLSDHTVSHLAATLAIGMGASAIEKHVKFDDQQKGPDSSFSLLPNELEELVKSCKQAWLAKGKGTFQRANVETENKIFRRSLYFVKDKKSGQTITKDDIRRIRPGFGIEPKFYNVLLGMKLTKDVKRGEPVDWNKVE